MTVVCWTFSLISATQTRTPISKYERIVARLRASISESIMGTVPIVQSQHRLQGNSSSHRFCDTR